MNSLVHGRRCRGEREKGGGERNKAGTSYWAGNGEELRKGKGGLGGEKVNARRWGLAGRPGQSQRPEGGARGQGVPVGADTPRCLDVNLRAPFTCGNYHRKQPMRFLSSAARPGGPTRRR